MITPNELALANMVLIVVVAVLNRLNARKIGAVHDVVNGQSDRLADANANIVTGLEDRIADLTRKIAALSPPHDEGM